MLIFNEIYRKCNRFSGYFLFYNRGMNDAVVGGILLVISLLMLCTCLVLMVKILNSALHGNMMAVVKRVINADLPGHLSCLTGYLAMLAGAGMTMVVQSSSVFTSALTPLVGCGVVAIERVYPLTLGSNIGTTTTGILAALAASGDQLKPALQIALCHLAFNVSGILLFYPVPAMRRVPIRLAKVMGNTTAKYRWFAIFYIVLMFFIIPLAVFGLSMAGIIVMTVVVCLAVTVMLAVVAINFIQKKRPQWLPLRLRNWDFLPFKWMHSLEPLNRVVVGIIHLFVTTCSCIRCRCCVQAKPSREWGKTDENGGLKSVSTEMTLMTPCSSTSSFRSNTTQTSLATIISTESGYASVLPTPCMSRLPSFNAIPEADETAIDDESSGSSLVTGASSAIIRIHEEEEEKGVTEAEKEANALL